MACPREHSEEVAPHDVLRRELLKPRLLLLLVEAEPSFPIIACFRELNEWGNDRPGVR